VIGRGALDAHHLLTHQAMLGDQRRLRAYDRALAHAVGPGDVVVDVGAGMLVLSMLALRHGARHVYAVEADPQTAAIAERIAAGNGLGSRLTLIQGDARELRLPEPADVLVSEMMGNLGPEEEMPEILAAVAGACLRPGGGVVPERLLTCLQAVELDAEGWGVWGDDFWGLSLAPVQEHAAPGAQMHFFGRRPRLLSEPVVAIDSRLGDPPSAAGPVQLRMVARGRLHAVVGYFSARLAPGVTLSNFPSYPGCNWATCLWPLRHTDVRPGDLLGARLSRPERVRVATDWQLDCGIARARPAA
jgi:hypothetical protein